MLESVVSYVHHRLAIKSLHANHPTTLIATGDSMLPLISPGTKITILPKKFSKVKVFDIVAANTNRQLVVHRCIFKSATYLVCHGLNNRFIDPPLCPQDILGIVDIPQHLSLLQLMYHAAIKQVAVNFKKPIIVLKGAPLQKKIFGYYLAQPSSDVDILIKKAHLPKLQHTLQGLGYTQTSLHQNETTYTKNQLNIDVHFSAIRTHTKTGLSLLSPQFNSCLLLHLQQSTTNLYFLQPSHQLLYLCLNSFFHHGFRGLNNYVYIAQIITTSPPNWNTFWRLAKKYHVSNIAFYSLVWTSKFFKLKIPHLSRHRPGYLARLAHKIFINQSQILRPLSLKNPLQNKLNSLIIIILRQCLHD